MTVVPEGEGKGDTPVTIAIPNATEPSRVIDPPDAVKGLAGQLRMGDSVKVTYQKSGTALMYKGASASDAPTAGDKDATFKFMARRKVRWAGKLYDAILAAKGSLPCVFLVATPEDKGASKDAEAPAPPKAASDLLEKLKGCRRGTEIRVTYAPFQYAFWLQDVEVVQPAAAQASAAPAQ